MMSYPWEGAGKPRHSVGAQPGSILDYALRYAARGWPVLPLHPIRSGACACGDRECRSPGKHPVRMLAPNGAQSATTNADTIRQWFGDAQCDLNIGVATGSRSRLLVVDLDLKPTEGIDGIEAWGEVCAAYGAPPDTVTAITGSQGQHHLFEVPAGAVIHNGTNRFKRELSRTKTGIDVRGENGYIVVEPSRHICGRAWAWELSSDPLDGKDPAPAPAWLIGILSASEPAAAPVVEPCALDAARLAEIRSALAWIPADDYALWIEIGQCLHAGGAPLGLWEEWAQKSEKYAPGVCGKKWAGFHARGLDGVTLPTLFMRAQQCGWPNPASAAAQVPVAVPADQVRVAPALPADLALPGAELLALPGRLQDLVNWYNATAYKPQPQFAVQAALAVGSVVCARRYATDRGTYSSLYLLCVAKSGAGKEHVKTAIERALDAADLGDLIGPAGYASGAAVFSALYGQPTHLSVLDELGRVIESGQTAGNSHKHDAVTQLMEAHGRCGGTMRPQGYSTLSLAAAQRAEVEGRKIVRPGLSLLAMTTPATFYGALSTRAVADGFLGRFLIVESPLGRQLGREDAAPAPIPDTLAQWARETASAGDGNLAQFRQGPDMVPDPIIIPFADGCRALARAFEAEIIGQQDALEGAGLEAVLGRAHDMAQRIALILALSDGAGSISIEHLRWAIEYVRHYSARAVESLRAQVADSPFEAVCQQVYAAIARHGEAGIRGGHIGNFARKFKALDQRQRDSVLATLREEGRVALVQKSGRGGTSARWVAVEAEDDE